MIHRLFFTPIYQNNIKSTGISKLNRDILKEAQQIKAVDKEGQAWSQKNYVGGYTSYASYSRLHQFSTTFMELEKQIDKHVKKYCQALEWDLQGRQLKMTTCWVNMMPSMVHHSLHLHPLSVVSGTYYVQVPSGAGALKIEDPRIGLFMGCPPPKTKLKKRQAYFYTVEPKEGHVVLWESWLRHEVPANRSRQMRVSVSFNYEWI